MVSTDPARPVDRPLAPRYTLTNTTPRPTTRLFDTRTGQRLESYWNRDLLAGDRSDGRPGPGPYSSSSSFLAALAPPLAARAALFLELEMRSRSSSA